MISISQYEISQTLYISHYPNPIISKKTLLYRTSYDATHIISTYWRNGIVHTEYTNTPLRLNSPCRGEGTYPPGSFDQVRQQGELVGATLPRPIRTNRSS